MDYMVSSPQLQSLVSPGILYPRNLKIVFKQSLTSHGKDSMVYSWLWNKCHGINAEPRPPSLQSVMFLMLDLPWTS